MEHGVEPVRQVGARRHLIGNARVADLRLGAHDALGDGRRRAEEGVRDLLGREAADLAQRQATWASGGKAGWQQVKISRRRSSSTSSLVPRRGVVRVGVEPLGELPQRRVEPGAPAQAVDGLEAAGRDEPRAGIGGHAVARPLLDGGREGLVKRLLGQIEVAEEADQGGEDAARLGAVDGLDLARAPAPPHRRSPASGLSGAGGALPDRPHLDASEPSPAGSSRPPGWRRSGPGPR